MPTTTETYRYEIVGTMTPEEVMVLARRILKENTVEVTADDLYNDPDRVALFEIARKYGLEAARLKDSSHLATVLLAHALVNKE